MLTQPSLQRLDCVVGFAQVGLPVFAAGDVGHLHGPGEGLQRLLKGLVAASQVEKHLVGLLSIFVGRRLVRLHEVQVEVARRLGRGALVGRSEEQVAGTGHAATQPGDLVRPDAIPGHVDAVRALQHALQSIEVVAVHLLGRQAAGLLSDQGVVVDVLFQVQVVLAVLGVGGDELAADRADDLLESHLDGAEQEVRVWLRQRHEQAEAIAQFLGCGAQRRVDLARGQPQHAQSVDQAQSQRAIGGPGVGGEDTFFENLAFLDHLANLRYAAQRRVLLQYGPVVVVADQARLVFGHRLVKPAGDGTTEGAQRLALLHQCDALEHVEVGGVDGEKPDEILQAFGHGWVERRKALQVAMDPPALIGCLAQQAFGDHEGHVGAGDAHLLETVARPAHGVGHKLEARAIEQQLLHAPDEAEASQPADLAQLAQEVEIEDEIMLLATAQDSQAIRRPPGASLGQGSARRSAASWR